MLHFKMHRTTSPEKLCYSYVHRMPANVLFSVNAIVYNSPRDCGPATVWTNGRFEKAHKRQERKANVHHAVSPSDENSTYLTSSSYLTSTTDLSRAGITTSLKIILTEVDVTWEAVRARRCELECATEYTRTGLGCLSTHPYLRLVWTELF